MKRKLAPKQRKFANEFIKTNNAYQSAIKAGYSKAYAKNASVKMVENGGIQDYIQRKVGKVEKSESDEADEVLRNIYRISAGKEIERHYVQIDNLAKEAAGNDESLGARIGYMVDNTTLTPASTKEQVAAAELWFKLNGQLKNESKEIEKQRIRKLTAEADIAESKAKYAGDSGNLPLPTFVDDIPEEDEEIGGDADGNDS